LHLTGFDLPLAELEAFRQWGSKTPGHPEWHETPGVEATTGPLGQGAANAVGMALAERFLAHHFNRPGHTIIDHFTFALVSDGDVMEGVACEAASIAGHLQLGKLIYLYDANDVTLDGPLSLTMSEDVGARYAACGWHVQHVDNGNTDLAALDTAIANAKAEQTKPSMIVVKTTIGYGSPKKAGTSSAHGSPLGDAEVAATKKALGWDPEKKFYVPGEVVAHMAEGGKRGAASHAQWREKLAAYKAAHPDLAMQLEQAIRGELPASWDANMPAFPADKAIATRAAARRRRSFPAATTRAPAKAATSASASASTRWRRWATACSITAPFDRSSPRSSRSATTCARRFASPRSTSNPRSSCGRTTPSVSARTAPRTSPSST
jgi:transketolase